MRAFAALAVPPHVREALSDACAPARALALPLRWVDPQQWHVTLAFYRDLPEHDLGDLTQRLRRAAQRCPPLPLTLARVGSFGSSRRQQVLWVGVQHEQPDDAARLQRLAAAARAAGRRVGMHGDELAADQRFRAHVTLARTREPTDLTTVRAVLDPLPVLAWTAPAVQLVRSELGGGAGGAPRYSVVATLPFRLPPRGDR